MGSGPVLRQRQRDRRGPSDVPRTRSEVQGGGPRHGQGHGRSHQDEALRAVGEGAEGVQGLHRRIFRQPRRLAGLPRSVQRGRSGVHASPRVHEGQGRRERQGDRPLAPQDAHGRGGAAGDRPASVGRRVPSRSPQGCDPGAVSGAPGPVQAHRGADDHLESVDLRQSEACRRVHPRDREAGDERHPRVLRHSRIPHVRGGGFGRRREEVLHGRDSEEDRRADPVDPVLPAEQLPRLRRGVHPRRAELLPHADGRPGLPGHVRRIAFRRLRGEGRGPLEVGFHDERHLAGGRRSDHNRADREQRAGPRRPEGVHAPPGQDSPPDDHHQEMGGARTHPSEGQEDRDPDVPIQAGFREDRRGGGPRYHPERQGHAGEVPRPRIHGGPRASDLEGAHRRDPRQHHQRPGVVIGGEGPREGRRHGIHGRVPPRVREAVGVQQEGHGGELGESTRRGLRPGREVRHPRDREREHLHRIPAAQVLGGPDGGRLPRSRGPHAPPVPRILQMVEERFQNERGHTRGDPRDPGMAAGEERRAVREVLPGPGPGQHPQHLSVRDRRPRGGDPVQEALRGRAHRAHVPDHGPCGDLRRAGGGGRPPAGVPEESEREGGAEDGDGLRDIGGREEGGDARGDGHPRRRLRRGLREGPREDPRPHHRSEGFHNQRRAARPRKGSRGGSAEGIRVFVDQAPERGGPVFEIVGG